MRSYLFLIALISFLFLPSVKGQIKVPKRNQLIEYPKFEKGVKEDLWKIKISSIAFTKEKTIVTLKITGEYGGTVHFSRDEPYKIHDRKSNKDYIIINDYPTKEAPIQVGYDKPSYVKLEFPLLPDEVVSFDLLQGNKKNGWNFYEINIDPLYYSSKL